MTAPELVLVGSDNLEQCGIGCIANRRHVGFQPKVQWLQRRFDEGLRYLLFRDERGKALAFLEFVPGEAAWRPVDADGWLFIHCLWVYREGQKVGGLGSRLIQACVEEARKQQRDGVAVMVSNGPWMVGAQIYLRNGFEVVDESDRFQLLVHRFARRGKTAAPSTPQIRRQPDLAPYQNGLHLVYAPQCPMLPKSVHDLTEMAAENGLELQVTELATPRQAQQSPSLYGVYALLWNGRLLADHYVSKGRFKGLLHKEILNDG